MKNIFISSTKILLLFLLFQVPTGCMFIPGRLIPTVTKLPDKTMYIKKPKVNIELDWHNFLKGKDKEPVEKIHARYVLYEKVKNVTEKSNLFESYAIDKCQGKNVDYTIQIDMLHYVDNSKIKVAAMISGLSLFMIPVAMKNNYKLTAKLLDANGNEIKTYVYDDYLKIWYQLFLLPFGVATIKAPNEVIENMIKNLYNDILNDNYLKYSN